ncbi:MAG: methyltransferase domain-containing protein [Crocinitomix sp.]|nr:methyltransferase domain-containing protein [Crocinitomix sp.]
MNYKLETIQCNICGADDTHKVTDKGQHSLPLNVVLCKACGLGYLNPRWDADGYLDFYKNQYDNYYRPDIKKEKKVSTKENPILSRLKERNLLGTDVKHILDIGSGAGDNLLDLGKAFPEAKLNAIEPSQESQVILKKNGIQVLSDDVNSNWDEALTDKFGVIIMRHVLEHFLDPLLALKRIRETLSDTGILYIAVPNNLNPIQSLEKSWFRVVHTYYFNKYSLANILRLAGLEEIEIVEGDRHNNGEVFLMARRSKEIVKPNISQDHYTEQRAVFERVQKEQSSLVYGLKNKISKVKRRFF